MSQPQKCQSMFRTPRWKSPVLLLLLALGVLLGSWGAAAPLLGVARADDVQPSAEEEERLEAIDRHTERGWKAFRTGNHEEVLARMKRLAKYDPSNPLPLYLTGRVYERTGEYEKALDIATAAATAHPENRRIEALRFKALLALGRVDAAGTAARAALMERPRDIVAGCVLGMTLEERGRRKEALAAYDAVVEAYNESDLRGVEIPWVARAAERATWLSPNPADDMLRGAGLLVERYVKAHPEDLDAKLQLAELFRNDRGPGGQAIAGKYYRQILKENSEVAEARVGRARSALLFYQQGSALRDLERALATNPRLVSALTVKAAIHIGNGDYKRALKALEQALAVNPTDKEARSVRAALHWIRGENEAYETLAREILTYDPTYGNLHLICAELIGERQRRYDVAAEFARKALAVDPADRSAYVVLGEALMNTGQTDEALRQFRTGVEKAKRYKDVRRDNWIEVLSLWMPRFKTIKTEHFEIRMPLAEWHVMRHYLPDLLEEAHGTLTRKYGYVVMSPTHADSFNRDDDFSVRSVGSMGLPALGVCFGNVITLLGPTAKPIGAFSWSRTAWHEFAHVVTLQLSKGQVPRWLTEGLSVFEEQARRPRWGRDMERQLFDRWSNDRLLKMSLINQAFRGPDIMFAYYQGGLIAQHLQQERGFEVIPRMLKAFAEDKTTAQVFKQVLDLDLDSYDRMFHEYVGTVVGTYRMAPNWDSKSMDAFKARTKKDGQDVEAWIRLAWGHFQRKRRIDAGAALMKAEAIDAEHLEVLLLKGRIAERSGRADMAKRLYEQFLSKGGDDLNVRLFLAQQVLRGGSDSLLAIAHLQAAKVCFPRYIGRDSPYLQLAKLYRGGGEMSAAMAELEAFAEIAAEHYGVRKELKSWYKQQQDSKAIVRVCEEMVDISPFGANVGGREAPDMELHRDYAEALTEIGRHAEALRERQVQVEMGRFLPEEERVGAGLVKDHLTLGNLYLAQGQAEDALAQALAALRLAPRDASALMLKRRAQEAGGGR